MPSEPSPDHWWMEFVDPVKGTYRVYWIDETEVTEAEYYGGGNGKEIRQDAPQG